MVGWEWGGWGTTKLCHYVKTALLHSRLCLSTVTDITRELYILGERLRQRRPSIRHPKRGDALCNIWRWEGQGTPSIKAYQDPAVFVNGVPEIAQYSETVRLERTGYDRSISSQD